MNTQLIKNQLLTEGFAVINNVFTTTEINKIIETIPTTETTNPSFRSTADLFAIRQFLKEVPEIKPLVFNQHFQNIIRQIFGEGYFVVKSIYLINRPNQTGLWLIIKT